MLLGRAKIGSIGVAGVAAGIVAAVRAICVDCHPGTPCSDSDWRTCSMGRTGVENGGGAGSAAVGATSAIVPVSEMGGVDGSSSRNRRVTVSQNPGSGAAVGGSGLLVSVASGTTRIT